MDTDVDNVPGIVDHDVAVVSVLDGQQISDDRIGSHRLDKVDPCLLELVPALDAKLENKVPARRR